MQSCKKIIRAQIFVQKYLFPNDSNHAKFTQRPQYRVFTFRKKKVPSRTSFVAYMEPSLMNPQTGPSKKRLENSVNVWGTKVIACIKNY